MGPRRVESLLAPREGARQKGGLGSEGGCGRRPGPRSLLLGCPETQVLREGNGISP